METSNQLKEPLFLTADITLKDSNGADAKSAPVRIVANTGTPVDYPGVGTLVWDFGSMTSRSRIPLDYVHEFQESIGYLNKFDGSTGVLICSGAIVPFGVDRGAEVIHKMREGVPYQASIESHGGTLQYVDVGESAQINGAQGQFEGPGFIVRDWTLAAVAVCKFGLDPQTSTELLLAAAKKKGSANKPLNRGDMSEAKQITATVEATAPAVAEVAQEATEKAPEVTEQPKAPEATEQKAEAVEVQKTEAVDADQDAETPAPGVVEAAKPAEDPRVEFKSFLSAFGARAADYYAEGLTFLEAQTKHVAALSAENEELKRRLSLTDRGADKPVKRCDPDTKKAGLASAIRINKAKH